MSIDKPPHLAYDLKVTISYLISHVITTADYLVLSAHDITWFIINPFATSPVAAMGCIFLGISPDISSLQ